MKGNAINVKHAETNMEIFRMIYNNEGEREALEWADDNWEQLMPSDVREIYHMTGVQLVMWKF